MERKLELVKDIELYKNGKGVCMLSSEEYGIHLVLNEPLFLYLQDYITTIKENNYVVTEKENDKGLLFLVKHGLLYRKGEEGEKKTTVDAEILGRVLYQKKFTYDKQSKFLVAIMKILILTSIVIFVINLFFLFKENVFGEIIKECKSFSGNSLSHLIIIFVLIILSFILHEFGHALFANYYNVFTKSITLTLYLGIAPMAYVKYRNIYKKPKKIRIIIYAGGMIMNLILANLAIYLVYLKDWWEAGALFVINLFMITNNIITFYKTDTYYILCELLELGSLKYKVLKNMSLILNKEVSLFECMKSRDFTIMFIFFVISYSGAIFLLYQMLIYSLNIIDMSISAKSIVFIVMIAYYLMNLLWVVKRIKKNVYR